MLHIWWPGNLWVTFHFTVTVLLSGLNLSALVDKKGKYKKRNMGRLEARGRRKSREKEIKRQREKD